MHLSVYSLVHENALPLKAGCKGGAPFGIASVEAQLPAHHTSIVVVPVVITYGAHHPIVQDLDPVCNDRSAGASHVNMCDKYTHEGHVKVLVGELFCADMVPKYPRVVPHILAVDYSDQVDQTNQTIRQ